jgi:hypothetical protein
MGKKENLKSVVSKEQHGHSDKTCPHMLRPDRCGLCLRERHYKQMYERMTELEKRLHNATQG